MASSTSPAQPHSLIPVVKRCGQPRITQAGIHALMLEHAGNHSSVLRLKSGDPLIFGRAGEEIAFLREHNIPFEIVPGITAAFAVAATLQTPLTDRSSASKLILATAHHAAGKVHLTPAIPSIWEQEATLILYMPGRDFPALATSLIDSGIPPATPCVAVSKASTPTTSTPPPPPSNTSAPQKVGPAPVLLLIGQAIKPISPPPES